MSLYGKSYVSTEAGFSAGKVFTRFSHLGNHQTRVYYFKWVLQGDGEGWKDLTGKDKRTSK